MYPERKNPVTENTWFLILTFVPVLGFVFYHMLNRNISYKKTKIDKGNIENLYSKLYRDDISNQKEKLNNNEIIIKDKEFLCYNSIIKLNVNEGNSLLTEDNDITIYTDAKDKFNSLLHDIKNAKESIHILYYIINNDNIGNTIVKLLTEKAVEGIKVRVLYDSLGSVHTSDKLFSELIASGGEVHKFLPLTIKNIFSLNYRNHRKIVVIDGIIGYIGGINIGDEYMGLDERVTPWRDTHLRLTGSSVHFLQQRFIMDWYNVSKEKLISDEVALKSYFPDPIIKGNASIQVVCSGPDSGTEEIKRSMLILVYSAKKEILIETPYFIPDKSFLDALQIVSSSGIDVRIILPAVSDTKFVYRATLSYIKDILDYGIKVYLYPGFIHAKMIVIDGKVATLGSANIDMRSFAFDYEANIFIYNSEISHTCKKIFEFDMVKAKKIDKAYMSTNVFEQFAEGISRLFSPLL